MPLYEFECAECGKVEAKPVKMGTKNITCACGENAPKIVSKPAKPIFKGSGFYETDYKANNRE